MCSSVITSSIGKHERNESGGDSRHDISNDSLDTILRDPRTKMHLLQKMGLEDRGDRTSPSKGLENVLCVSHANLNPSGMSAGGWPPAANWLVSFPGFPAIGPNPVLPGFWPLWLLPDTA